MQIIVHLLITGVTCVIKDLYLKWNLHIISTVKKLRSMFSEFKTLNNILSTNTIKTVFCTIVQFIYYTCEI